MASSAKKVSLCLLLTLLCSLHSHARDSQVFNKIPSTTNNVVVPTNQQEEQQQQQPNFLPQNEDSYGLYGHESGQNPPSTAAAATTTTAATTTPFETEFKQPEHKYLPKNYNPVAYVTVPENDDVKESTPFNEETSFATKPNPNPNPNNNNNYYNGEETYYNNQQQEGEPEEAEFQNYPANNNNGNSNYYYNGGSRFNSQPESNADFRTGAASTNRRENYYFNNGGSSQPQGDTEFMNAAALTSRGNYFDNGAAANGFQPQGMSDTRSFENGKYFYDVNSGKYSSNHPYQSLRGAQSQNQNEFSNRNLYGNNANQFNAGGFNNREEFQYEESMP